MTAGPTIIVGTDRTRILLELGLPRGLLDALVEPIDPITAKVAASDGTGLAEITHLPGVGDVLPPGRIVPVCHVDESQLWYILAVEQPDGWVLLDWGPEDCKPIDGGVPGWLTDLVVRAWRRDERGDVPVRQPSSHHGQGAVGGRRGHVPVRQAAREGALT